jgi:pimeloyl-ACP methyl ester carboxylesterase
MPHLSRPDTELHYEDTGGSGRPVVLIHGWPLSGEAFAAQVGDLTAAGHRVVTYDRRGFGRSGKPGRGYDYGTLTDDLAALIDHLDLDGVVLLGFSMGAGEVVRYLSTRGTERVAGAVLAAGITPFLQVTDDNPDGAMGRDGFTGLQHQCRADRDGFLDGFLTAFFSTPTGLKVTTDELAEARRIAGQGEDEALVQTIGLWADDFRADLAGVDVPLLVIHGDGDQNVPFERSGRRTHELVPRSVLHIIDDGPHGINVSHRHEFNSALLEFLERL